MTVRRDQRSTRCLSCADCKISDTREENSLLHMLTTINRTLFLPPCPSSLSHRTQHKRGRGAKWGEGLVFVHYVLVVVRQGGKSRSQTGVFYEYLNVTTYSNPGVGDRQLN